jgi:hypothetical protein
VRANSQSSGTLAYMPDPVESAVSRPMLLNRSEVAMWFKAVGNYGPFTAAQNAHFSALREALLRVIASSDAVLELGVEIESNDEDPGSPSPSQQESVFRTTKLYLDAYYSCLSQLCAVLNEFPSSFGRQFSSKRNSQFLIQLIPLVDGLPEEAFAILDYARDFRALLAHPSSFAPMTWMTLGADQDDLRAAYLVFVGSGTPTGDTKRLARPDHAVYFGGDWLITAPDLLEVDVVLRVVVERSLLRVADRLLAEADSRDEEPKQ